MKSLFHLGTPHHPLILSISKAQPVEVETGMSLRRPKKGPKENQKGEVVMDTSHSNEAEKEIEKWVMVSTKNEQVVMVSTGREEVVMVITDIGLNARIGPSSTVIIRHEMVQGQGEGIGEMLQGELKTRPRNLTKVLGSVDRTAPPLQVPQHGIRQAV